MADFRSVLNKIPIIGGLTEAIGGSPEQENMQRQMQRAQQMYQQQRPWQMEAGMNAFNNTAAAFNPMQSLMGQMYGPSAQMDMSKIVQNPFPEAQQRGMYADAFGATNQNPFFNQDQWAQKQMSMNNYLAKKQRDANTGQVVDRLRLTGEQQNLPQGSTVADDLRNRK